MLSLRDKDRGLEIGTGIGRKRYRQIRITTRLGRLTGFQKIEDPFVGQFRITADQAVESIDAGIRSCEIASLLIISKLEQYDYTGATAIATMMLAASFVLLLTINLLQWWAGRNYRGAA